MLFTLITEFIYNAYVENLCTTKNAALKIIGTKQVIGVNMMRNYGKTMAHMLGFPDPIAYTGNWLRRSFISLAADSGLSTKQIMALSGHKNENVVNHCMAKSDYIRRVHANAVSLHHHDMLASCWGQQPQSNNSLC